LGVDSQPQTLDKAPTLFEHARSRRRRRLSAVGQRLGYRHGQPSRIANSRAEVALRRRDRNRRFRGMTAGGIATPQAALEGRYQIERELGAGGMGTVYLARDLRHGRTVAVKVFHAEIARSVGADRFLRARCSVALDSARIPNRAESESVSPYDAQEGRSHFASRRHRRFGFAERRHRRVGIPRFRPQSVEKLAGAKQTWIVAEDWYCSGQEIRQGVRARGPDVIRDECGLEELLSRLVRVKDHRIERPRRGEKDGHGGKITFGTRDPIGQRRRPSLGLLADTTRPP
jgi:hypothetical protein